jgi:AAA+ ATPase superfamily predicted ATPase
MIGRKKEIQILESLCSETSSKLIVVEGRRRIGKTYLVDYMFKEHRNDCLYFDCAGAYDKDNKTQLKNLLNSIYIWFKKEPTHPIADWTDLFFFLWNTIQEEIKEKQHNGKVVMFIDEIPWIDPDDNNSFLSALGYFWNQYCLKENNFILILCGSNSSWVTNKILKDKNGSLHKRVDKVISLKPFTLLETKEYLVKEKRYESDDMTILDAYMVLGGVAKYLSYLDKNKSIYENIDEIFFSLSGQLYDEYETLFYTLFGDKNGMHKKIMDALASKKSGLTKKEIAIKIKTQTTDSRVGKTLDELELCRFINGLTKFGNQNRDIKYIIADNYCLFYKKWLEHLNKNDIARLSNYWSNQVNTQSYNSWAGFAFELICINNIDLYLEKRGLKELFKSVNYWQYQPKDENDKGAQIDLLIEYKNNMYEIVECKFYNAEYTITKDYVQNLANKKAKFIEHGIKTKRYDIRMSMLTSFGVAENSHFRNANIVANIKLCDMLDM